MIDFCLTHKNINRFPVLEDEYAFSRAISLDFPNKLFTLAPSLSLALPLSFYFLTLSAARALSLSVPPSLSLCLSLCQLPYVVKGNRIEAGNGIGWGLFCPRGGRQKAHTHAKTSLWPFSHTLPLPPSPVPVRVRVRVHVTTAAKQLMLCQKTRKWTLCLADCVLALTNATVSLSFCFLPISPSPSIYKRAKVHIVYMYYIRQ